MLELRSVRENPDAVRDTLQRRGIEVDLERLLALDGEVLDLRRKRDEVKAEVNRLSKSVPKLEGEEKGAAIARSSCDLPAPDGPVRAVIWPAGISSERFPNSGSSR